VIQTLIVDDEPLARSRLRAMLAAHPDIDVVAECGSAGEAMTLLQQGTAALLLLDIEMPGASGFDTFRAISMESRPAIVFVTAHEEFALDAFEANAVDYLVKPFSRERLDSGAESHLHRESLQNVAAELDPAIFLRVHRSAIVNIERVQKLVPAGEGSLSIVLYNGTTIPLGPTYRAALKEALGERF
jgi:two-component system LytT family response regulator